jgi:PilZ domain
MDGEDLLWSLADNGSRLGEQKNPLPQDTSAALVAKRKWTRFAVDMSVEVRVTTQGPTRVAACEGHGTDISVGGLAVTADIDLPVGAQVGVEFTLPYSDQSLIFRCFVRNRHGNCYGVEFITENDEDYRKTGELQAILATMNADAHT